MSNPNTSVTLIEAAKFLGVSTQTVRRLIQRKTLTAVQALGPHGLRWEIDKAELLRHLEQHPGQQPLSTGVVDHRQHHHGNPNTQEIDDGQHVDNGQRQPQHTTSVPLVAHLAALDLARIQIEHLQGQVDESHRLVLNAERSKMAIETNLQHQVGQYQRILTDHAESLAEERALRIAAELRAAELQAQLSPPATMPEPVITTTTHRRGWGSRLKGWLLGEKTG